MSQLFTNYGGRHPNSRFHSTRDQRHVWDRNTAYHLPDVDETFSEKYEKRNQLNSRSMSKKVVHKPGMNTQPFLKEAFAKSSITGINNIASSESIRRKICWTIVFIGCLVGFGYQALLFTNLYNSKPSVVQTDVEHDGDAEFPAVTICNLNRIRKSQYCKLYPNRCKDGNTSDVTGHLHVMFMGRHIQRPVNPAPNNRGEICEMRVVQLDKMCRKEITDERIRNITGELLRKNQFETKVNLGHPENMIESCIFHGVPMLSEKECLRNLMYSYDPDYGNCYTIPSRDRFGRTLEASAADFWQEADDMSVMLNLEVDEFMEKNRDHGAVLTVHAGSTFPDAHTQSIKLATGRAYHVAVKKETMKFLPFPYKTNCTDYFSLPWAKGNIQLTSRMCTVGCSQHHQLKACGYVTEDLSLFYDKLPWDPKTIKDENRKCAAEIEESSKSFCRKICSIPCKEVVFNIDESAHTITRTDAKNNHPERYDSWSWEDISKNLVHVKVYYKTLDHMVFEHKPKYYILQLFSYLGSNSGVWLGFSFLTVYEIFEILMLSVRFALCHCHRNLFFGKESRVSAARKLPKRAVKSNRKRNV